LQKGKSDRMKNTPAAIAAKSIKTRRRLALFIQRQTQAERATISIWGLKGTCGEYLPSDMALEIFTPPPLASIIEP